MNRFQKLCLSGLWVLIGQAVVAEGPTSPAPESGGAAAIRAGVSKNYGNLPMSFELNRGQAGKEVKFLARGQGYSLLLAPSEVVLSLRPGAPARPAAVDLTNRAGGASAAEAARSGAVVRMTLGGANSHPRLTGVDLQPGKSNYFIGNDPAKWRLDVPQYAKVRYAGVYPGIDLVYYGNQRQLEYDFVVAPGGDPRRIALDFKGVEKLALDAEGNLVLSTASGQLIQHKPVVYQDIDGIRHDIDGHYVLRGNARASFQVAPYDASQPLIIDPTLVYSTYLGGSGDGSGGDSGNGIALWTDGIGNTYAYVVGTTFSNDFPTANAYQSTNSGNYGLEIIPTISLGNVFVTRLNASGTGVVYSTYLGGCCGDTGNGIAVDTNGNAYVTGSTNYYNALRDPSISHIAFPTTGSAYQGSSNGIANDASNIFVTKLSAAGNALLYSTYLGGSGYSQSGLGAGDVGTGIAVGGNGNAYVTGYTYSSALSGSVPFPTTAGAYQSINNGGASGDTNAFVAVVNPNAIGPASLVYSTYLGGDGRGRGDSGNGIAVDGNGNAVVTGNAFSSALSGSVPFPTTAGAYQSINNGGGNNTTNAFVAVLNPSASGSASLLYSTYLGGSGLGGFFGDFGFGIAVAADGDGSGNAYTYVTGKTSSSNFPTTVGAYNRSYGGSGNVFVAKLNTNAAGAAGLIYSTFLGGGSGTAGDSGKGIAVDGTGNAYVTGYSYSNALSGHTPFPTTADAYQSSNHSAVSTNAFVVKLNTKAAGAAGLVFSTYLGGSGAGFYGDAGSGIAVDGHGSAYVAGTTFSNTPNGDLNNLVCRTSAFSATFGTSCWGGGDTLGCMPDPANPGLSCPAGYTLSPVLGYYVLYSSPLNTPFPTTPGAYQSSNHSAILVSSRICTTFGGTLLGCIYYLTPLNQSNAFVAKFGFAPASQLAITSVNGGSNPTVGVGFGVVVQAQDGTGTPSNVLASTGVTLSRQTGTGVLGGTLSCTITAGTNSCTVSGVTYSKAESGVSLTATRTSGDALAPGDSSSFTVIAAGPVARVFLSVTGADGNVCSTITTPCRTFAGAITQADPGGEVIVVDSGSYGGATITKSVTINGPPGVVAFTGQPIVVNAGSTDTVVLRGLTSKAATAGTGTGIQFVSGAAVRVEGCVINGWATGIDATGPGELLVLDSAIRNSTVAGVSMSNATARGVVGHSRLEGNAVGIKVSAGAATVRDSVVSGQSGTGLVADGGDLSIEACVVANNGTGVTSGPGAGTTRIDGSTVTDNTTGLLKTGSGVLQSRGNNTVSGNGTDTSGAITSFSAR